MAASLTGIELTATYFILNFLVVIFPLTISVNGQETKGKWGTRFYPAPPGNVSVTVFWKLYWFLPVNKATTTVSLADGEFVRLQYDAPFGVLSRGRLGPVRAA